MAENQYPISRDSQILLWNECMEDALEIAQEYQLRLPIAVAFFAYRIGFLADRLIQEVTDDEVAEILKEDDQ